MSDQAKKSWWIRLGEAYYDFKESHTTLNKVNRKTYCWLCLLGIVGAHHFYARHWVKGIIYAAMSWTGISAAMGLIDWMVAVPKQADEEGNIYI